MRAPYWGSRSELIEVLELAQRGQVSVEIETFSIDEAPKAYESRLEHEGLKSEVVFPNVLDS